MLSYAPVSNIVPSGITNDNFARSVAISGDGTVIAVGDHTAYSYYGCVNVYIKAGDTWTLRDTIVSDDSWKFFGISVSLNYDGTILAIGAPLYSSSRGQVRVYEYASTIWALRDYIQPLVQVSGSEFGYSVSLTSDGLILAVGASKDGTKATEAGSAYVFDYSTSWSQRANIVYAPDFTASDHFGTSVSLSDNGLVLAVGAQDKDVLFSDAGKAYTYDWNSGASVWDLRLSINGEAVGDNLGSGVALNTDGTIIIIGASHQDILGTDSGLLYHFVWSGSTWDAQDTIHNSFTGDLLGTDCDITPDAQTIIAGLPGSTVATPEVGEVIILGYGPWTQTIEAVMPRIDGVLYSGAALKAGMPLLDGLLLIRTEPYVKDISGDLPTISGDLTCGGGIEVEMPMFTGVFEASFPLVATIKASMPSMTMESYGAGLLSSSQPSLTGSMSVTVETMGQVQAAMPLFSGAIIGSTEVIGNIAANMPSISGSGNIAHVEHASLLADMPMITGGITGSCQSMGNIFASLPLFNGKIHAVEVEPFAITATMPMLTGALVATSSQGSDTILTYVRGAVR